MLSIRHLAIVCIAALLGPACPAFAQRAPNIKLATLAPKGTSFHHSLLAMGEKWKQAPGGGVRLTIYTDGVMGGEVDVVKRMRVGQLQASMLTAVGLSAIDDSILALQNMPMMFRSLDELDYVFEKLQPELEKRFREKGFEVLFWGDAGWVHFFSSRPVLKPADYQQLKIFVWAGDSRAVDLWRAAGYRPVPLEPTDILTGLQTGLIEAVASTPAYALAGQFYGPAPHMLEINWAPLIGGTVMTRKAFDALSPQTQAAIREAAREAGRQIKERSRIEAQESIAAMKKNGLVVHPLTPELTAAWQEAVEQSYPRIRETIVPAATFDKVRSLLDEYRRSQQAQPE